MTFWDYFEEISNIPVLIVLFCFSVGIFNYIYERKKYFLYALIIPYFVLKFIFYIPCILFCLTFGARIKKMRSKNL
ncbi:MAG: hypothetical protein Athens071416_616 [Parcubacteria group bacterium Athens0714_16]|nr:MAG: hypothetical protein Athens071416_616 [Parcubacteria group bacterium Athens0714_16]